MAAPVHDSVGSALRLALQGLSQRQRAAATNIANLETPGYRAQRVSFEASLRAAVEAGQPASALVDTTTSDAVAGANGNNVAIDDETMILTETGLRYQLLVGAVDARFRLMRTAIGRGA